MNDPVAFSVICDDLLISVNGKQTISGVVSGDLIVPDDGILVPQFILLYHYRSPLDQKYAPISLEVIFPGEESARVLPLSIQLTVQTIKDRNTMTFRIPFLINNLKLIPGPIDTRVNYSSGSAEAGRHWIVNPNTAAIQILNNRVVQ